MNTEDKEIKDALTQDIGTLKQSNNDEHISPLNFPVIDRSESYKAPSEMDDTNEEPLDAPRQGISEEPIEEKTIKTDPKIALESAKLLADSILGGANMVIGVGGGYFVKIRKSEDFFEFDDIVELIDEQNQKNVERIKLDQEDIALLKPLLVEVLKNQVEHVTPEKQLLGALVAIIIKKYATIKEIKAENDILYQKLVSIIRSEKIQEQEQQDMVEDNPDPIDDNQQDLFSNTQETTDDDIDDELDIEELDDTIEDQTKNQTTKK